MWPDSNLEVALITIRNYKHPSVRVGWISVACFILPTIRFWELLIGHTRLKYNSVLCIAFYTTFRPGGPRLLVPILPLRPLAPISPYKEYIKITRTCIQMFEGCIHIFCKWIAFYRTAFCRKVLIHLQA